MSNDESMKERLIAEVNRLIQEGRVADAKRLIERVRQAQAQQAAASARPVAEDLAAEPAMIEAEGEIAEADAVTTASAEVDVDPNASPMDVSETSGLFAVPMTVGQEEVMEGAMVETAVEPAEPIESLAEGAVAEAVVTEDVHELSPEQTPEPIQAIDSHADTQPVLQSAQAADAEDANAQDGKTDHKKSGKKKVKNKKKRRITAAVVVGVFVLAVIGLLVWHEQPSFCSAICHTPMDAYGKTYDGKVDAYGNELTEAEADTMLAYAHSKYMGGITCMGCHEPVLSEQISEGLKWVAGDYYIAGYNKDGDALLEPRSLADLTEARDVPAVEFCVNDKCHVTTPDRAALFEKTKYLESEYNPHSSRHGEITCGTCHKGHTQSVNYCTECHASAPVPEGWLTMNEAQDMGVIAELNVEASENE